MLTRLMASFSFSFLALAVVCAFMALQELNGRGDIGRVATLAVLAVASMVGFLLGVRARVQRMRDSDAQQMADQSAERH